MKKIISLVLMVAMLLSALPAMADNVRTSGLYTYEIKGNGTITITDFDWANSYGDIFIPNMIDGYTVTGIGAEAFMVDDSINGSWMEPIAITLCQTITTIGEKAFFGVEWLTEINLHDNIQYIGYGAFAGCDLIQYKLSPNQAYFAEIDGALYNKSRKELIACSCVDELVIPEGIISIGDYAFCHGAIMESIHFPTSLREIGNYAFYDCFFGSRVFRNEDNFNLGSTSIVSIGEYAFSKAGPGTSQGYEGEIILPISLESIGAHVFEAIGEDSVVDYIINIKIPGECKVTIIPDYAFYGVTGEVIIDNPSQIIEIGEYAGCGRNFSSEASFSPQISVIPTGLDPTTNSLPSTITEIQSKAFSRTVSDFVLPSSLTKIAIDAFGRSSTFIVESGSYAELWCNENGFGYSIEGQDNLDWLNN